MIMAEITKEEFEKIKNYKYRIEVSIIDAGELVILEDYNIISFIVENDYKQNFFPLLNLKISVSRELFHRIQIYRNQVKFRIVVKKYEVNTNEDYSEEFYQPGSKFSYSVMYDSLFQPIVENIEPYLRKDMEEGLDLNTNTNMNKKDLEQTKEADFEILELYLFNLNNLNSNKKIFNAVLANCNSKNAIGFILNQSGIPEVLMNQPDISTVYDQILIPPYNLRNSIESLDRVYGIYNSTLRQFLDFNMYYILSSDLTEVPVKLGEYENVFINIGKVNEPTTNKEGCYKDNENQCYRIFIPNTVNISTKGSYTKEIDGNKYKIADLFSIRDSFGGNAYNDNQVTLDGYDNDDKTTFIYNHMSNNSLVDTFIKEKEEDNLTINLTFTNIDLEMLTLNKRFILRFDDINIASKYNGTYRLHNMTYGLDKSIMYAVCDFKLFKR